RGAGLAMDGSRQRRGRARNGVGPEERPPAAAADRGGHGGAAMTASMRTKVVSAAATASAVAASAPAAALAAPPRPPMPPIRKPSSFDPPEADAVPAALQVFPPDNWWNRDVSALPVHRDSAKMIAGIGVDKPLEYNLDMGFIIVPADQKRVEVKLLD